MQYVIVKNIKRCYYIEQERVNDSTDMGYRNRNMGL